VRNILFFLGFSNILGLVSGGTKTQILGAIPIASRMPYNFTIFPINKTNLIFFLEDAC